MWSFAAPLWLALLPLPLLMARLLPPRAEGWLRVPPGIAAAPDTTPQASFRRAGGWLPWVAWSAILLALADPSKLLPVRSLHTSGRDIVLALDLSGSMERQDFTIDGKPVRRLDALKRVARNFIHRRSGDRIGLVVFAENAYVAAAPSFDLAGVAQAVDEVEVGLVGRSTAIGEGLGLAMRRLQESSATSRVVVLLSDGANNAGSVKPIEVAHLAHALGIRVHTIALGLHDLVNPEGDPDTVDSETLAGVAATSGGTAFRVRTTEELEQASRAIDQLESSRAVAPPALVRREFWTLPGTLGLLAACASLAVARRRP